MEDTAIARVILAFPFPSPTTAVAIVLAESEGDSKAVNSVGNTPVDSRDRGWWQFNSHWHPEVPDVCAFDPKASTAHAYIVSKYGTDFKAWSAFKSGTYKRYLPRATAAVNAVRQVPT